MFKRISVIFGLVIAAGAFGACAEADSFIQYLAGIEVLRASRHMNDEQKAVYYKKLSEVTGISAREAVQRIARYYDRPQQWKQIQEEVRLVLEEPTKSDKE